MTRVSQNSSQQGAALAVTILMVTIVTVVVQSMFFLATSRARIASQLEDVYAAEHIALNGLECGLGQAIFQQALAGGEARSCNNQAIELDEANYEDYNVSFVVYGDRATCAEVFIRQNKTDDYTIRSVGYLVCGNDGPLSSTFDQQRIVRTMHVVQTDEGQVSRSLVEN